MPSFDIVNKVNAQEVDNAFQQARKEIEQRYDFKGTDTHLEKKDKEQGIQIRSSTEQRLEAAREVLVQKLAKRGVSLRGVKYGSVEQSGKEEKQPRLQKDCSCRNPRCPRIRLCTSSRSAARRTGWTARSCSVRSSSRGTKSWRTRARRRSW